MPSSSKGSRKKKAGKPTESMSIAASLKPLVKDGGKNGGNSKRKLKQSPVPQPHWFTLSTVWRLLLWLTLYTVLFQCPTSPDPSSPTICHVYSKARGVANPYYENYVTPYVDKVAPHISRYNEAYFYPAFETASTSYGKYVQPIVQKAKVFVEKEYQEKLHPTVAQVYSELHRLYLQHLAPYTSEIYKFYQQTVSSPYWKQLRLQSEEIYDSYLIPAYKKAYPYLDRVYENGRYVTIAVLGPYVKEGARMSGKWLEKNVWHGVSDLWKDYVEVQVGRIKDRVNSGNENSSSVPPSGSGHKVDSSTQEEPPEKKAVREAARKQIEEDLAFYTDKFEKHANEAIESLNAKVDQIAAVAMKKHKPMAEKQMKKLDQTISTEMRGLKATIMNLAKYYKPGSSEEETESKKLEAFNKLFEATSSVGKLIKDTAQELRWESQRFLATIFDEVAAEADTRIEKLDALIDSGIQELGMKWAWQVDGATYKDWARYQDLKKEFSGIKTKIVQAAEKNKRLNEITLWAEGDAWEGGANARAKEAAGELMRIKRVAKKKIELNDYSEDFSDKYLNQVSKEAKERATPGEIPAPKKPAEILMAEAQAVLGEQHVMADDEGVWKDTLPEKLKDSVEDINGAVSKAVSEAVYGTKTEQAAGESITPVASDLYNSAWTAASSALYGTPEPGYMGIATDKYSAAIAAASSVIYGIPQPLPESIVTQAGKAVESVRVYAEEKVEAGANAVKESADAVASVIKENAEAASSSVTSMVTPPPAVENILNSANYKLQEIVELASEKIYSRESGTFENGEAYNSAASQVPETHGAGPFEAASRIISEVAKSASAEITIAVYGTPIGKASSGIAEDLGAATSVIAENIEATASIVGENIEAAKAAVRNGREEEKYYASVVESAEAKLQRGVESASARLTEIYEESRKAGGEKLEGMVERLKGAGEEVGEAASKAAEKVKEKYEGVRDEL